MSNEIQYVECICGNNEMPCDYNEQTGEFYEFCDVCSSYTSNEIINRPKEKTEGWIPKYRKTNGKTGYVMKIWSRTQKGMFMSCVDKTNLKRIREDMDKNNDILKYAITFKDTEGNYQTQIFKK